MKQKVSVIKIGGSLIEDEKVLDSFLKGFAAIEGHKILVHGGGKLATELASRLGIETKMTNGRRITDKASLEVITMVYGGLVNKSIVAKLQSFHCNAIGLSGADANSIASIKRPVREIDYGFVGDVEKVSPEIISLFLTHGITPVFCALTHDQNGRLLNTNADTIASEVAIALSKAFETHLYFCFEKAGVLKNVEDENSVIEHINSKSYENLLAEGIISDGMLPKLHNCFQALKKNVSKVCIGNIKMISDQHQKYTTITL